MVSIMNMYSYLFKGTSSFKSVVFKEILNEVYIEKFDEIDDFLQSELQENINNFHYLNLKIIAVRVTKPIVPKEIMIFFQALEEQKTAHLKVAEQTQKVKMKEAVTS